MSPSHGRMAICSSPEMMVPSAHRLRRVGLRSRSKVSSSKLSLVMLEMSSTRPAFLCIMRQRRNIRVGPSVEGCAGKLVSCQHASHNISGCQCHVCSHEPRAPCAPKAMGSVLPRGDLLALITFGEVRAQSPRLWSKVEGTTWSSSVELFGRNTAARGGGAQLFVAFRHADCFGPIFSQARRVRYAGDGQTVTDRQFESKGKCQRERGKGPRAPRSLCPRPGSLASVARLPGASRRAPTS